MELNGYEYVNFEKSKNEIKLPNLETEVKEGELILNLYDGRR